MKICKIEECDRKMRTGGLCNMHAVRLRQTGTTDPGPKPQGTLAERFWRKVEKASGDNCWLWKGGKTAGGYGRIQLGGKGSLYEGAHRLSYELAKGPIPDGLVVMHTCDNPNCVNPAHLVAGTYAENTADMIAKGRQVKASLSGEENPRSKLTEALVRYIRANPQRGHKDLADELGLSPNAIRGVRTGRTWSHVT